LLGSKNSGDVVETIRLLISLKSYRFPYADIGIRKMLVLIWSKEKTIIEELFRAYWQLYFDTDRYSPEKVAGNLIHLYNRANLTEKTSLEEIILYILSPATDEKDKKMKDMFYFPDAVFKILWNIFLVGFQNMEKNVIDENDPRYREERQSVRSALEILRNVYSKKRDILNDKLDSFNVILKSFLQNQVHTLFHLIIL
jgi:condensin complex subunit 1